VNAESPPGDFELFKDLTIRMGKRCKIAEIIELGWGQATLPDGFQASSQLPS
jgi:hypothetical protein